MPVAGGGCGSDSTHERCHQHLAVHAHGNHQDKLVHDSDDEQHISGTSAWQSCIVQHVADNRLRVVVGNTLAHHGGWAVPSFSPLHSKDFPNQL